MNADNPSPADLGFLSSLGFGPDSPLMNEPRLLVDGRFLGAVMVELEGELGAERAHAVFYQIGFFHGLRDAHRMITQSIRHQQGMGEQPGAEATPLAISLGPRRTQEGTHSIELSGEWPEAYEAQIRLARLGAASVPSCWLSAGYTAGWLSASFDANMVVVETECTSRGDASCRFESREAEAYRNSGDTSDAVLADARSFDAFRSAMNRSEALASSDSDGPLDPGEFAIHVWGPVMVLPFTDVEIALQTVEMLAHEADTTEVRAVVLDLRSTPLDEGYGASTLEQVVECIESWGAEAVLTGVADLSEGVISNLETARLLIRKDVSEAIATAFQIAEVQRHPI